MLITPGYEAERGRIWLCQGTVRYRSGLSIPNSPFMIQRFKPYSASEFMFAASHSPELREYTIEQMQLELRAQGEREVGYCAVQPDRNMRKQIRFYTPFQAPDEITDLFAEARRIIRHHTGLIREGKKYESSEIKALEARKLAFSRLCEQTLEGIVRQNLPAEMTGHTSATDIVIAYMPNTQQLARALN
ncbi:hypothetical protein HY640_01820 [Candidatus Woesearchaeota archaeon]|nr:hypothetical protein [Candidatus Woesearchaeota archaeon]